MRKQIILKNTTLTEIELPEIGETIPVATGSPSLALDVSNVPSVKFRGITGLQNLITAGTIIVGDGVDDYPSHIGYEYLVNDTTSDEDGFWYGNRRRFSIIWDQPAHGFVVGNIVKLDESTGLAALALADSHANSSTTAFVSEIISPDSFYAGLTGSTVKGIDAAAVVGGLPLILGEAYFLSTTNQGMISASPPVGAGEIIKLVGVATNTDTLMGFNYPGYANETAVSEPTLISALTTGSGNVRTPNTWQRAVITTSVSDPISLTPSNGDRYLIPTTATGAWTGYANMITEYVTSSGTWHMVQPVLGFTVVVSDEKSVHVFDGTEWAESTGILVESEGVPLPSTPHKTLNFIGAGVTVIDNPSAADIVIPGNTPNIFYAHNGGVEQTLSSSFKTVNMSTVVRSDAIYNKSALDVITINEAGWYKVSYSVGADASSNWRSNMECQLEHNNSLVAGSMSWSYHRTHSAGKGTASADVILLIAAGDTVRVRTREASGNIETLANGCRLVIEQIEKT